jgi:hypothetical protein
MKKPALLLCVFLALQVLPANAEMIVNDHFDGSSLDPSWNVRMTPNTSGWNYNVQNSQINVNQISTNSSSYWGQVYLSQQINPIDDFNAEIGLSWNEPNQDTIMYVGMWLYDTDYNVISANYFNDAWLGGYGKPHATFGDSVSRHWDLPLSGSATASMIREDGIVNYYWDGILLNSKQLLKEAAYFEIGFGYHPAGGGSPMGNMNVDYVTLEGNPVDINATPEPGTMMLLGSALGLGAWWQRRRKRRA